MKKISVIIAQRHNTSLTLEEDFYAELLRIAKQKGISINALVTEIDAARTDKNLSAAIRVYILNYVKREINASKTNA